MIQTDARDYTDPGCDDVRGIEAAAQSNLDYSGINVLLSEIQETESNGYFKKLGPILSMSARCL